MWQKTTDAIMAHAAVEYPKECCGVIAQKSRVERYFPCKNLSSDPTQHFYLSPEDYAAAEDWGTVTAIVHSHPDATSQPSEVGKAQCDATLRMVICERFSREASSRCLSVRLFSAILIAVGW